MECRYRMVKEQYIDRDIYYAERLVKVFGIRLGYFRVGRTFFTEAAAVNSMVKLCADESFYEYITISYKENNIL